MITPGGDRGTEAPRKVRRRPRLTGRDWKILALLGEYGCVTGTRIKAYFWNSSPASCAHYRRLGILIKRSLIEKVSGDRSIAIGYRLTKKGKEVLGRLHAAKGSPLSRRAYKTQFEHDQLLIDARRILEKSPLISNFKTETEIRNLLLSGREKLLHWENAPVIPDAIFTYSIPGKTMRVALELELTLKVRRRYTRIFRSHLLAKDWGLTIYVVKGANFRDQLMKVLDEVKSTDIEVRMAKTVNGIYFCTLEDFLLKELSVLLANRNKEFSFAKAAQIIEAKT